jgi:hypothetical protein
MNTKTANPFTPFVIARFKESMNLFIEDRLDIKSVSTVITIERVADLFSTQGENGLPEIANILKGHEIQLRWNYIFRELRSKFLAEWIKPYVVGNLLDLLCGDGDIGKHISDMQVEVTLSERRCCNNHRLAFIPYQELRTVCALPQFDTVLLSTVLHHTPNPNELILLGTQIARKRLIIIENCLEQEYPLDFHLLMDLFFNFGLNQLNEECPGNHRDSSAWYNTLLEYGSVVDVGRKDNIPGVPLPHHIFIIDVEHV